MAVKTLYVGAGNDGNFGALVDGTAQAAASRTDGWTVAKLAAAQMAEFDAGTKQASGAFSSATKPASFITGATANAFLEGPLNGDFANTAWTFTFALRCTVASSQRGRIRMRVFKSANVDGSGATELTAATQIGTTVAAALSTTADQTSVVTWSPGATITLSNEYLFFVIAWEITTASGSNSGDVVIRTGSGASVGSFCTTPNYTAATLTPISRDATLTLGVSMSSVKKAPMAFSPSVTLIPTVQKKMPDAMPVSLVMSPAVVKKITRPTLPVTLSLTGAMVAGRTRSQTFDAILTFAGASPYGSGVYGGGAYGLGAGTSMMDFRFKGFRSLPATFTLTPTQKSVLKKPMAVILTLTADMTQQILRTSIPISLNAILTLTPAQVRKRIISFPVGLSLTPLTALRRLFFRPFASGLTLTPTMSRKQVDFRAIAATLTLTPLVATRQFSPRSFVVALVLAPVQSLRTWHAISFSRTLTLTPFMQSGKLKYQNVTAGLTLIPAMTKLSGNYKSLAASLVLTPVMARFVQGKRVFSAVLSLAPSLVNMLKRPISTNLTLTPTMAKTKANYTTLSAILSLSPVQTLRRYALRGISASLTLTATLSRRVLAPRSFPVGLSLVPAQITRAKMFRQFDTGLDFTATLKKTRGYVFNSPLNLEPLMFVGTQIIPIRLASTFRLIAEISVRRQTVADILLGGVLGVAKLLNAKYSDVRLLVASMGKSNLTVADEDDGHLDGASLGESTLHSVE